MNVGGWVIVLLTLSYFVTALLATVIFFYLVVADVVTLLRGLFFGIYFSLFGDFAVLKVISFIFFVGGFLV